MGFTCIGFDRVTKTKSLFLELIFSFIINNKFSVTTQASDHTGSDGLYKFDVFGLLITLAQIILVGLKRMLE